MWNQKITQNRFVVAGGGEQVKGDKRYKCPVVKSWGCPEQQCDDS